MNKYFNYFLSVPSALILMLFFACAIGYATFIENDYGTIAARALIFNSWWLELCLVLLCIIFISNIFRYKLYFPQKIPILCLHLSFIFIILGAGVTRYIGVEGVMRIREGGLNNQFISSNLFLEVKVHNNQLEYHTKKELLLSSISNNYFHLPIQFETQSINIEYQDFIHDPIDKLLINQIDGKRILEFIIPSKKGGMESKYLIEDETTIVNGLMISFNSDLASDISIYQRDSVFYFYCKYDVEYMKMSDQAKGVLLRDREHVLNHKTLYTVNGKNIVFKNYFDNANLYQESYAVKNDESKLDLLRLRLTAMGKDTIIDLHGGQGLISSKEYFTFNNLFFSFSYGAVSHN